MRKKSIFYVNEKLDYYNPLINMKTLFKKVERSGNIMDEINHAYKIT